MDNLLKWKIYVDALCAILAHTLHFVQRLELLGVNTATKTSGYNAAVGILTR